jgi:CubicO group peptidase (beta-lactamase class C family)
MLSSMVAPLREETQNYNPKLKGQITSMKSRKNLLIIVAFLIVLFQVQLVKSQSPQFQTFIEDYLTSFPGNSEIAIGIIDGDNTYKIGYRLENGKVIPVENQSTLFEIGSITKVFTSALLMKEVKRNTIALDDPIQKHLTFKIKQGSYQNQPLTILHLITHTSGLKKNPLMSYKRYCNYLEGFELTYTPGKNWEYNNLAVGLAGQLAAEKNKTSWEVSLRENLLRPLNMDNTYTNLDEVPKTNRVQCVNKNGKRSDCYFHKMGSFQWPDGGIVSNIDDMTKWLQVNLYSDEGNPALDFIQSAHNSLADSISISWFQKFKATQGIGWWHYRTDSNNRIICHGGNMPAQTSFIAFDKEKNRGIIILTNVNGRAILNDDKIMKTTDLAIQVLGL